MQSGVIISLGWNNSVLDWKRFLRNKIPQLRHGSGAKAGKINRIFQVKLKEYITLKKNV